MNLTLSTALNELRQLSKLAIPMFVAQLAVSGLGLVDTLMSGQVGTNDLAAIGLGTSILFPIMMLSIGILLMLNPLIAKQFGDNNHLQMSRFLVQAFWLAIPLSVIMFTLLANGAWVLDLLPLTSIVYKLTEDYLFYIAFGLPGLALFFVIRFFWEGMGLIFPTMWISIGALILNIPLNAVFIYGFGPIEAFGAAGCGIASSIVMWVMFALGITYALRSPKIRPYLIKLKKQPFQQLKPQWKDGLQPLLMLGIPNTFSLLFEVSLFSLVALFVAQLGTEVIAAQQVSVSVTSILFMLPLSISMALTFRVGEAFGQKSKQEVLIRAYTGIGLAAVLSLLAASITYGLRWDIAQWYTDDHHVIAIAIILLGIAAFYQLFDAIQVATAGVLRGLHDTQATMWVTFVCYWGIGLGGGYLLAFSNIFLPALGVTGFWVAIVAGFLLAAIALQVKLFSLLKALARKGELV